MTDPAIFCEVCDNLRLSEEQWDWFVATLDAAVEPKPKLDRLLGRTRR